MQTNEALVEQRAKVGRIVWLMGMGILIGGLAASWMVERRPELTTPLLVASYVALIGGLVTTSIGIYMTDRWAREPRADQSLRHALKGMDNRHKLYNYLLPAEHVLLSPFGVTVFKVKRQDGRIEYEDGRWRHRQGLLSTFLSLSRERLGDPVRDLEGEMERMSDLLQERLPDVEVPVEGVIVFTGPQADLHVVNPPLPVRLAKKLKAHVRGARQRSRLSATLRRELEQVLDDAAAA